MFNSTATLETDNKEAPMYVGRVVFNDDPFRAQRVKVVIPTVLEGPVAELPWVGPKQRSPFGVTGTAGTVNVPLIDSLVIVRFQNGDPNLGLYEGYVVTANFANSLPAKLLTNYPHRYGFVDNQGNTFFIDNATSEVEFAHKSGALLNIKPDGEINVSAPQNINVTSAASVNVSATQNINLTASSLITIEAPNITSEASVWQHTGLLQVRGSVGVIAGGGLDGVARFGQSVIIEGDAEISNISFLTHVHPETNAPSGNTLFPIQG